MHLNTQKSITSDVILVWVRSVHPKMLLFYSCHNSYLHTVLFALMDRNIKYATTVMPFFKVHTVFCLILTNENGSLGAHGLQYFVDDLEAAGQTQCMEGLQR